VTWKYVFARPPRSGVDSPRRDVIRDGYAVGVSAKSHDGKKHMEFEAADSVPRHLHNNIR
jgi:hypothetical protein